MQEFSSSSEFQFVKNLTPRMYDVDPTYKTNKCRLMWDVRLLHESLDGKIPPVTANDAEQLRLLITKLKKTKNIADDSNSKELAIWANSASIDSNVNSSKHNDVGSTPSTNSSKKSVGMSGCRSSDSGFDTFTFINDILY